jgi:ABC-type multidrug transport system ATPase subunit
MIVTTKTQAQNIYPLMTVEERLRLLRQIRGIWKDRKPDPIEELNEIRKGWSKPL